MSEITPFMPEHEHEHSSPPSLKSVSDSGSDEELEQEHEQEQLEPIPRQLDHGALRASLGRSIVSAAQKAGGTLFGGAVRNKIAHDIAAEAFYAKCDHPNPIKALYHYDYSDPSKDPSTIDRLIQDLDLDIWFQDDAQKAEFKKTLLANHMWHSKGIITGPAAAGYEFLDEFGSDNEAINIEKMNVSFWAPFEVMNFVPMPAFKVDMVTGPPGSAPPFGHQIDFECNGIMLDNCNEYKLMPTLLRNLSPMGKALALPRIISDIQSKCAIMVSLTANKYRMNKLLNKKWIIKADMFRAAKYDNRGPRWGVLALVRDIKCEISGRLFEEDEVILTTKCCRVDLYPPALAVWLKDKADQTAAQAAAANEEETSCKQQQKERCPWCESTGFKLTPKDERLIEMCR